MARETVLIDDLDGGVAVGSVTFSYGGKTFVIDLNQANTDLFDQAVAPFIEAGREVEAFAAKGKPRAGRSDLAQIREWATANGHEVSQRGRIGADIVAAYDRAMESGTQDELSVEDSEVA
jgi:hypothetical protein